MNASSAARVVTRRDFLSGNYTELLEAPFLLIEDSNVSSAHPLVSNLLRTAKVQYNICFVTTETAPAELGHFIEPGSNGKDIMIVDAFSNAAGWQQPDAVTWKMALRHATASVTTLDSLQQSILTLLKGSSSPAYLVFDSISPLIRRHSAVRVSLFLSNLLTSHRSLISNLIVAVHEDLHDDLSLRSLEYISTCFMRLTVSSDKAADAAALITQKRRSGKVHRTTEYYRVEPDGKIRLVRTSAGLAPSATSIISSDPSHLIDNLTLEQKAAKDAVKLPFEHQGRPGEEELFLASNNNEEEDDPDADLDI